MLVNLNLSFLRSLFSEPEGTASMSRALLAVLFAFVVGVGAALTYKVRKPISVEELDEFLQTASIFLASTCAPLYATNKIANVINNKIEADTNKPTTTTETTGT